MRLFKRYNLCLLFLLLAREGSIRSTSELSSQDVRDDKVHGDFLEDWRGQENKHRCQHLIKLSLSGAAISDPKSSVRDFMDINSVCDLMDVNNNHYVLWQAQSLYRVDV